MAPKTIAYANSATPAAVPIVPLRSRDNLSAVPAVARLDEFVGPKS
jgi:hypothetical protein